MGLHLQAERCEMRCLEDNLEGFRMLIRRCPKNALIAARDDRTICGVGVDFRSIIARKNCGGRGKRGFQQVACQGATVDIAIDPLACVVGMEGDDAVKAFGPEFLFKQANFGFFAFAPKAAVQVLARLTLAASGIKPPWIANRIHQHLVKTAKMRMDRKVVKKLDCGDHTGLFVPMDSGEDADPVDGPVLRISPSVTG